MPPLILSIETATLAGSICLSLGTEPLHLKSGNPQISHSNTLLSEIDDVLKQTKHSLADIDFFSVAIGPGSFTGLRIGIATVKALSETLEKPCLGIPTLAAIAHSAGPSSCTLALLPAGRGEVFAQSFSVSESGTVRELDEAVHLPPMKTLERYGETPNLLLTGEGARVHFERFEEWASQHGLEVSEGTSEKSGWRFVMSESPLASDVAVLALNRIEAGDLDQPNALQAIYVRPSDAELKKPSTN